LEGVGELTIRERRTETLNGDICRSAISEVRGFGGD
jgi:hypothetical protein